jgi:alkanesulfonate monooxygenase SsuD/methylene tetrahydromethanopterin reductase-like flavin-dependent oxidoreductase (luciferase family)
MDFGLALPSYRLGASTEGIDAAADLAGRLGWHSVFTTDHVLVEQSERSEDYFSVFDALLTLAHVAARQPELRVAVSVIVVPMRNAVLLAKELATLDALSGGRLIVGVGVLWSGQTGPFEGRFHSFGEIRFGPLPVQGAELPIWVGGRSEAALSRAGRLGHAYHSSASSPAQLAVRVPVIHGTAEAAGRPRPLISARVRVHFGAHEGPGYVLAGTPEQMISEVQAFTDLGVEHFTFDFSETDPQRHTQLMERFDSEVLAALR